MQQAVHRKLKFAANDLFSRELCGYVIEGVMQILI